MRPLKSTAKRWEKAPTPNQKYRDRKRITLPIGEKKDVVGYGPTKKAATQDLYEKIERLHLENPSGGTITMTQLMARLLRHKRSVKGRNRKTLFNDACTYRLLSQPHVRWTPITDVTLADLQAIQYRLVSDRKYRTAELATILLKSLFKFAVITYRAQICAGELQLFNIAEDLDAVQRPTRRRRSLSAPGRRRSLLRSSTWRKPGTTRASPTSSTPSSTRRSPLAYAVVRASASDVTT